MKRTLENGVVVLTADKGMKLTNDSSFVSVVRLGKEDDGLSWHEITDAEAEELQKVEEPAEMEG